MTIQNPKKYYFPRKSSDFIGKEKTKFENYQTNPKRKNFVYRSSWTARNGENINNIGKL
eukprot:UN00094